MSNPGPSETAGALSPAEMQLILGTELRGICVVDDEGACRFVTQKFCDMLGYSEDQVLGCPLYSILRTTPPASEKSSFLALQQRDLSLLRRDGSAFPARVVVHDLASEGHATGHVLFVQDLTDEKHAEDVLRKTEKLASAGRMAAVIAHEINNPLEAVINLLYLLRFEGLSPEADRLLSLAESEVERVSRIARQTLAFYRESGKPGRVDLRELLNMSVDVHAIRNPELRVHRRYRTTTLVSGYASELQQVFHNLVGNAVEAGAHDIYLHLRLCNEAGPPRRPGVRITIGDNGSGIDESVRRHLFNPFFTTKGEAGTGLGLWTSRGIILRHEGSIHFRSSTRRGHTGTCFEIFLPC